MISFTKNFELLLIAFLGLLVCTYSYSTPERDAYSFINLSSNGNYAPEFLYNKQNQVCSNPQHSAYFSFEALGNRDQISDVISQINPKLQKQNIAFNKSIGSKTITYNITNFQPQFYYNQHYQKQSYFDEERLNVTLGIIELSFHMDYYILQNGQLSSSGWCHGKQYIDSAFFLKKIVQIEGSLQWQPQSIPLFGISSMIPIDYSQPKLSHDDLSEFEQLINGQRGESKIKQNVIKALNSNFGGILKGHLNKEHLFQNKQFTYSFKQIQFNYTHSVKIAKILQQQIQKGLFASFELQIKDYPQRCSSLPQKFNQSYNGGAQEYISMATLNSSLIKALNSDLFKVQLGKNWQSKYFQFYMGDLSNIFPNADNYFAADKIGGKCQWNQVDIFPTKLSRFDQQSISTQIPYKCILTKQESQQQLFSIQAIFTFIVRIIPNQSSLDFVLAKIDVWNPLFKAIKEDFVIPSNKKGLAQEYIKSVMETLIDQKVFGTGWKTITRRYPSLKVYDNYVLVFDPSQI